MWISKKASDEIFFSVGSDYFLSLSDRTRIAYAALSLIILSSILILFRLGDPLVNPASWLVVVFSLMLIPLFLNARGATLYAASMGVIAAASPVLNNEAIKDSLKHPGSGDFWTTMVIMVTVAIGITLLGFFLGKIRVLLLWERQTRENRSNFISVSVHDLRNLLATVKGYVEIMGTQAVEPSDARRLHFRKAINRNFEGVERLLNRMTDLGRLDRGLFEINTKHSNFWAFLEEIMQPYQSTLKTQLSFAVDDSWRNQSVIIDGDEERLGQIITNLMENAIKHSDKKKRKITISSLISPQTIRLFISDNGAGIDSRNIDKIFEQFVSFPSRFSRGGTGIGLFVSKTIAKAHGGSLTVQSEGIEHGSTFCLELPRILSKK